MSDSNTAQILLIEDDSEIVAFIETELQCEGYKVEIARDGQQGLIAARQNPPDLIVLDRMLPGLDGLALCRRLRQSSDVPILMLTARSEVKDRVEGLDAGANDYLVKPFDLDELLARIRVQIRQRQPSERTLFEFADLKLDIISHEVYRAGQLIMLSPKEFELLHFFLQYPRHVLTRHRILEAVWGWDFEGEDNVLEVYIRYLRKKIELEGFPRLLHTVRGVGYVLREEMVSQLES
ncbi:DNA-binding response regulator [bacterium (Candidatus Blackallbacteria) CG17_big_fil_post_rev_8_21_14_2_50_48_46]|uniref:DNA-binding response regulator n=1 Tax=bacterium (Candidatus Blackallbacteria) CG17_big_fil_post_rev_8_21_14_2_50_48_46 TaxID=2014261 RepID=A0A2M7G2N1_9BACT|nr:MAG: DNA-binding response regulator [bacterium (Candidatus Blackallbacteria) CG18_big_fil_WC_8_21_14_2_50_49_26]PIW16053.1 MAG: DNA-binding response regulator [bacterium (Candidatus Blackallbacteria) CG17_big_fil_post_rev_8_21_14_2_50_48_46]PIW50465.1 MAG: DNA-binding response regulator [bacterium (Candidatus Blackallbacteria) CG13_big_fil_rev_8_21_14_2_50_49_14]